MLVSLATPVVFAAPPTAESRTLYKGSSPALTGPAAATMRPLTKAEQAGTMNIAVFLRLRDADELQARVNRNEVIFPEEMAARYLPLAADYENVTAWLRSEGFTVTRHDDSHLGVFVRGTVAQVQQSFQVQLVGVTVDGVNYPAANSVPSLPASVAGPVAGLLGFHPYLKLHSHIARMPRAAAKGGVRTNSENPVTSSPYPTRAFSPAQILTAFNGASLTNFTGTGQRIAILAESLPATSDLTTFWSQQGVTRTGTIETSTPNGTGGTSPASDEVTLDSEWSSSIAPGANVRIYAAGSTQFSAFGACLQQMIDDIQGGTAIQQLSISYGLGEVDAGSGAASYFSSFDNQYMLILSGLGVSIFSSSGDGGSFFTDISGNSPAYQTSYYSTSPNITAVGGTSLGVNSDGTRQGEDAWSGSGGGASIVFSRPSWQKGNGVPAGNTRLVPDVSLPADPYTGAYLTYNGDLEQIGGTSWSSPTWAGFCARINQSRASQTPPRPSLGLVASRVYPLIGTSNFFDITNGSNANNGATNFPATVGYDEATGIGTPNMATLLGTLSGPTITNFAPKSGVAGSQVYLVGTNLSLVASVTFGNKSAVFTYNASSGQIAATVPAGAINGPITVSNAQVASGVNGDAYTTTTNFSVNLPDLTVAQTANGTFTQGDAADTYTVTVSNVGAAVSSGTVSLSDSLPRGLTAVGLSGTGWTINPSYLTATRTDSLAANASYPPLTLTVGVAINAPASVNNSVFVSGGGDNSSGNNSAATATSINAATPNQAWRYQYFGTTADTGNAADGANPSGDGLSNLLKYALGLSPLVASTNPETEDTSTGYLRLTVPKNPNATDLTFNVQVTGDLTDPNSWTTTGTTVQTNTSTQLQVSDNTLVTGAPHRFLRLQVTRP